MDNKENLRAKERSSSTAEAFTFPEPESPLKSKPEKPPCRVCTDFKTWIINKRDQVLSKPGDSTRNKIIPERPKAGCPLDKDDLGRNTWSFLHTMAAYFPDEPSKTEQKEMSVFIKIFSKYYPCDHCAKDFREEIKLSPPDTRSRLAFSVWLCQMHNIVNRKLGKEEFDCRLVDERWRDGWSSGICDE